ncbi:MAG: AbiV family abortive infection protein [Methylobacterium sp.]|nr:AbiV family abortive infection protein [Rhodobacter sp.]MCA3649001.1 AbiV family abortive infection protein [Methylobacterium sp.]MCA3654621.1 AbiV family abortive infection protein [Methylobacterium sp.]MCA3657148.1 AbiV family abortive infection protein [Methylobacterium sp.]MCA3664129.1 AbiV family abortive infection protein [Methylobacterium sp.]
MPDSQNAILDPTLELIKSNALRLLNDARLLFNNGSYPSSVYFSILSIEESGKFRIIKSGEKLSQKNLHRSKQKFASSYLMAELFLEAIKSHLDEMGLKLEKHSDIQDKEKIIPMHFLEDQLIDAMANSATNSRYNRFFALSQTNAIQDMKHRCVYVDVGDDLNAKLDHGNIEKFDAEYWVEVANSVLPK